MSEPIPEKPPRRPRYSGKNPRLYAHKYKELQPERYADDLVKVIASGRTPAGTHRPIMVQEVLDVLAPQPGEVVVDCTLGYGGHAKELLAAVQPGGRLLGIDADPVELPKAEARLRALGFAPESLVVRRMNYASLSDEWPEGADVILVDLGLSSMQIDDPARGFSYKSEGPLDMRMDATRGEPASAFLTNLDRRQLTQILEENADEPHAERLAYAILQANRRKPLATTLALADAVRDAYLQLSADSADDAIRRVFQSLRIAVNDEFTALETFLRNLPACLKPGGRVAILAFHSGEDRRVKAAFKSGSHDGSYTSIARDVIRASAEERRANPRSTSAKLRYAVRA